MQETYHPEDVVHVEGCGINGYAKFIPRGLYERLHQNAFSELRPEDLLFLLFEDGRAVPLRTLVGAGLRRVTAQELKNIEAKLQF